MFLLVVKFLSQCLQKLTSMNFDFLTGIDSNKYKGNIYMVFEYMDHDLTGLADRPGLRFTIPQIKVS